MNNKKRVSIRIRNALLLTKYFLTYNFICIIIVIREYKTKLIASETKLTASETKLIASEEEQKELLRVLELTKRMAYARDQQISMLESDGQLMLEKCEC